jgi:hypothetical protein
MRGEDTVTNPTVGSEELFGSKTDFRRDHQVHFSLRHWYRNFSAVMRGAELTNAIVYLPNCLSMTCGRISVFHSFVALQSGRCMVTLGREIGWTTLSVS